MSNLRQAIAASESVRMKFLHNKPFTEEDVRMELSPSTDLRAQLDEAMQLILALTAANQRLRTKYEETIELLRIVRPDAAKKYEELWKPFEEQV